MTHTKPARKGTQPTAPKVPSAPAKETVGRKYNTTHYAVHSRLVGGDGTWYGASRYKTQAEAQAALDKMGSRYVQMGGGLTLDFGAAGTRDVYDYRIVRVEAVVEVLAVCQRRI